MSNFPKVNQDQLRIENRAIKETHNAFSDDWIMRQEGGKDLGRDLIFEKCENGEAINYKVAVQVKGRSHLEPIRDGKFISIAIEIKTVNYALNDNLPFYLFVYVGNLRKLFFIDIKEYFNNLDKPWKTKQSHNVNIPIENIATPVIMDETFKTKIMY